AGFQETLRARPRFSRLFVSLLAATRHKSEVPQMCLGLGRHGRVGITADYGPVSLSCLGFLSQLLKRDTLHVKRLGFLGVLRKFEVDAVERFHGIVVLAGA